MRALARRLPHAKTNWRQASDHALLARIAAGDTAAFACFYDRIGPAVFGLCASILREPEPAEDAEDTARQALIELWRSAPCYDPSSGSPTAWALTIARRRAVQCARNAGRHERAGAIPLPRSLAALDDEDRQVIELAYYSGHTVAETATMLDVALDAVTIRVRDALHRLQTHLLPAR